MSVFRLIDMLASFFLIFIEKMKKEWVVELNLFSNRESVCARACGRGPVTVDRAFVCCCWSVRITNY